MKSPEEYIREDGKHKEPNFFSIASDIIDELLPDEKEIAEKIFGYAKIHNMSYNEKMLLREMAIEAFRLKVAIISLKHEMNNEV